ncbi:hypothetical protein [Paraglaciecola aestuariivivens]
MQKLAKDPHTSWIQFKRGVGIFCIGAVGILLGAKYYYWLQIPGLLLLVIGSLYAIKGYFGILAYRMSASFTPPPSRFDKDK